MCGIVAKVGEVIQWLCFIKNIVSLKTYLVLKDIRHLKLMNILKKCRIWCFIIIRKVWEMTKELDISRKSVRMIWEKIFGYETRSCSNRPNKADFVFPLVNELKAKNVMNTINHSPYLARCDFSCSQNWHCRTKESVFRWSKTNPKKYLWKVFTTSGWLTTSLVTFCHYVLCSNMSKSVKMKNNS